jgi:glycerol-3-phosphate dehydrogenase
LKAVLVALKIRDLLILPAVFLILKIYYGSKGIKISLATSRKLRSLEPNINGYGGIVIDGYGIIDSFKLIYRLYTVSVERNIEFLFNSSVVGINIDNDRIVIDLGDRRVTCRYLVNSSGLSSIDIASMIDKNSPYRLMPKPGAMIVFDRIQTRNIVSPIQLSLKGETKGGGVVPTLWGTTIWGTNLDKRTYRVRNSSLPSDFYTLLKRFKDLVRIKGIPIKIYVGVRPSSMDGDFHIVYSKKSQRIVNLIGIESPGLTAAPAIARIALWMLWKSGLKLFSRKPVFRSRRLSRSVKASLHNRSSGEEYRDIVCPCMNVSLGMIREAVEHGVSTLDGLCFYTKLGMGTCQGQNCLARAVIELSKMLGISPRELRKGAGESWIVK